MILNLCFLCFYWNSTKECVTTKDVLHNTAVLLLITQECQSTQQQQGYSCEELVDSNFCNTYSVLHLTQVLGGVYGGSTLHIQGF